MMENVIKILNAFVQSSQKHETLSAKVRALLKKDFSRETPPKLYYNLTELCNPQAAYWTRLHPEIQESRKLKVKFGKGNRIHERVENWFFVVTAKKYITKYREFGKVIDTRFLKSSLDKMLSDKTPPTRKGENTSGGDCVKSKSI